MIPKENRINIVFGSDGKAKLKSDLDAIPTPVVEELINNTLYAYESAKLDIIDTDERIKYLKKWIWALSMALTTIAIMAIISLVR